MAYNPPRKNVQYIFYIGLISQATGQLQANPTIAAGDFKVSTDGGAFGNLGTLPAVTPAGGKAVKITLSNTEMNGDNVVVIGSDAAGAEWNDVIVSIQPSIAYSTDGVINANLAQILGTALTETAGQIAAAFKKFFDKATPTGTINSLPDAVAGAAGGVAIVGSVMGKSPATLAAADVSGNLPADLKAITAGVDLSATMKSSVTTSATAATPTVTISSGSGAGQLDITSGVVKSNMTQIDGQATNGFNATLKLKQLYIFNTDGSSPAMGIESIAYNALEITGAAQYCDGVKIAGGDYGVRISGDQFNPYSGKSGLFIESSTGKSIEAYNGIAVQDGDLTLANLQIISAGQITVKKNVALPNFAFVMTDTDGVPLTGLSPAAERRIDSGSFAACANTPATELANGWYTIDLADSDLNGTIIALRFSDTGAADTNFTIVTQD